MKIREKIITAGYVEQVEKLALAGTSYDDIKKKTGADDRIVIKIISGMTSEKKTIRKESVLRRYAEDVYYDPRWINRIPDYKRARADSLFNEGKSCFEIAFMTGIDLRDVFAICCGSEYINRFHFTEKELRTLGRTGVNDSFGKNHEERIQKSESEDFCFYDDSGVERFDPCV